MSSTPKLKCKNCQSDDFELLDGLYFCSECGVQFENLVEMEHDEHNEMTQTQHRIRFATDKKKRKDNIKNRRLTSWEEYNFILIGLVDEILAIKEIPNFKSTCLQLWIAYLRASEAAFFSKHSQLAPKLFATYRQADAEILYNKKPKVRKTQVKKPKLETKTEDDDFRGKRKQMKKSERIISQELSASESKSESFNTSLLANLSLESIMSDHENAELDIEFSGAGKDLRMHHNSNDDAKIPYAKLSRSKRANILTGNTLLNIIYSALNICKSDIQLTDLIRFIREGHLSFYNPRKFLPDEILENDVPLSFQQHHSFCMVNYENTIHLLSYFVRIIPDLRTSFIMPDLNALVRRYLSELSLPRDLGDYIERVMNFLPSKMPFLRHAPNYEGRAMAYILFTLKLLFGIDGFRELEMSRAARRVNREAKTKIFVYEDWRKFIEYRQVILSKFYHPSLIFGDEHDTRPYVGLNAMLESLNPKTRNLEAQKVTSQNEKRMRSKQNVQEMTAGLAKLHGDELMKKFSFHCSLTPLQDNFKHILEEHDSSLKINKKITEVDHSEFSCEAFLRPKKLMKNKNLNLHVRKSTFPKCFAMVKSLNTVVPTGKEVFELDVDGKTEEVWRSDLKKRNEMEEEAQKEKLERLHKNHLQKVLKKRRMWRKMINEKKEKRNLPRARTKSIDENILSDDSDEVEDEDFDEIDYEGVELDPELDEIFKNFEAKKLTFIVPDFNLWHRMIFIQPLGTHLKSHELEKLPRSFVWLLKIASSVLNQYPLSLYLQLVAIEHQFINVYQPVELMENAMLKQSSDKNLKFLSPQNRLEAIW